MEADKEHPGHPARYQEQRGRSPRLSIAGSATLLVQRHGQRAYGLHGAVSFSPPPFSRAVTASFPSRVERKYQNGSTQGRIEQVALNEGRQY